MRDLTKTVYTHKSCVKYYVYQKINSGVRVSSNRYKIVIFVYHLS